MRSLIEDIRDVRFHKVETSLESFEDARSSAVRVCISEFIETDHSVLSSIFKSCSYQFFSIGFIHVK